MLDNISLSVLPSIISPDLEQRARHLAHSLGIQFAASNITTDYSLTYTEQGLALLTINKKGEFADTLLHIDFIHGKNGFRHANDCTTKQPLAKAVGIKPGFRPTIFDATAGLGGDGFVLACLGCKVTLCERSPILHSLLEDALKRAQVDFTLQNIIDKNTTLFFGNAADALSKSTISYHTIYMDPMYPHRTKSALNKKEMRVIRTLVGDDDDSALLLGIALEQAEKRVVVKRPKGAPLIGGLTPSHEIKMKNSRFDVYLTNIS